MNDLTRQYISPLRSLGAVTLITASTMTVCLLSGCSEYAEEPVAEDVTPDTPPSEVPSDAAASGDQFGGGSSRSTLGKARDTAENLKSDMEKRDADMRRIIDGDDEEDE